MPASPALRAGVVAGLTGALLVAPQIAYAAPVLGPVVVPVGGTATINDPAANYPSSVAVQLSAAACTPKIALATTTGPWIPPLIAKSSTSVSFVVPQGPVAGTNGAAKAYNACIYDTAAGNSALQSSTTLFVGSPVGVNPGSGQSGGGNQITVTARSDAPVFTATTSVAAVFTTGSCAATLGTANPANMVATNVTRQTGTTVGLTVPPGVVASGGGAATPYTICLYDSTGAFLTAAQYGANVAAANPSAGSYLASNAVSLTSPLPFLTGVTSPTVVVASGGCPPAGTPSPGTAATPSPGTAATLSSGTAPITLTGSAVRRITASRLLVNLPPLTLTNNQPTPYQICVYGGGPLLASASYTAALTGTPTAVSPSAGPMTGGNVITVLGSDFPTESGRITATLGGVALTNIQSINDRAFTALAPAHPAEDDVTLIVTTPMGTRSLVAAYSYLNMIKVTPNTVSSSAGSVDIMVQGSKFLSIPFGTGGTAARIFLVNGVYDGADVGDGTRANGPVTECTDVLPFTDEELVCTLQLGRRFNAAGTAFLDPTTYANNVDDANATVGSRLIVSNAGRFSRNDVGQPVTSTNSGMVQGATISAVLSPTRALISKPSTIAGFMPLMIGGPLRQLANAVITTAGSPTVSLIPGWTFTKADVGRIFGGATPGVANGTTIVAVGPGGTTATLSTAATASTTFSLTNVTATDGSTTITSPALTGNEAPSTIGPNTLGIPVGTTVTSATPATPTTPGTAILSMPAVTGGQGTLTLTRQGNTMLFPPTPVPNGSYHLTIVSNAAPDAATTDPTYFQSDVTSSSVFTVAPF